MTSTARKDHTCYLCELVIPRDESHVVRVGTTSDGFLSMRMHVACEALTRDWGFEEWECHDAGDFRDWMIEPRSDS